MMTVSFLGTGDTSPRHARIQTRRYASRRLSQLWRHILAADGKPQFLLGVIIISFVIVILIQMFVNKPYMSEEEELLQSAFARFQRSRAEWTPPEVWWNQVSIQSSKHGTPDTFFRLRLMILTDDTHADELRRLLTSLVSANYINLAIPIDVYVTVTMGGSDASPHSRAVEGAHAEVMRLLGSFAWIHGRYDVQLRRVGNDTAHAAAAAAAQVQPSPTSALPAGQAPTRLQELWFPTSCWELGMFLNHHTVLAPTWFSHVLRVIRTGLVDKGVYDKLAAYNKEKFRDEQRLFNRISRDSIDDILAYVHEKDSMLGFALSDFYPVQLQSHTTLTIREGLYVDETPKDAARCRATTNKDSGRHRRGDNGCRVALPEAYWLQNPGGFGTVYLPYTWRQMLTWVSQKRSSLDLHKEGTRAQDATALPQWQVLLRYMKSTNTYVLYPGMPHKAQIALTYTSEGRSAKEAQATTDATDRRSQARLEALNSTLRWTNYSSMDKLAKYRDDTDSPAG